MTSGFGHTGFSIEYPINTDELVTQTVRTHRSMSREFQGPYYKVEIRITPLDDSMSEPCGRVFRGNIIVPACHGFYALMSGLKNFWEQVIEGFVKQT